MNDMMMGLQLMGYGIGGVFLVLILFYVMIVLLKGLFPIKKQEDNTDGE